MPETPITPDVVSRILKEAAEKNARTPRQTIEVIRKLRDGPQFLNTTLADLASMLTVEGLLALIDEVDDA